MSDKNDREKMYEGLTESMRESIAVLNAAFDRYNDLVSELIKALDMDYSNERALKVRILEILKRSLG